MPIGVTASQVKKPAKKPPLKATSNELVITDDVRIKARDRTLAAGDGSIGLKINHMIKSRFRILYIRSHEEKRVREFFKDLTIYRGQELFQWDCDRGLRDGYSGESVSSEESEINDGDPTAILEAPHFNFRANDTTPLHTFLGDNNTDGLIAVQMNLPNDV